MSPVPRARAGARLSDEMLRHREGGLTPLMMMMMIDVLRERGLADPTGPLSPAHSLHYEASLVGPY